MRVTVHVRPAWWLRHYLAGVVLMSRLTGCELDAEKVGRWGFLVVTPHQG